MGLYLLSFFCTDKIYSLCMRYFGSSHLIFFKFCCKHLIWKPRIFTHWRKRQWKVKSINLSICTLTYWQHPKKIMHTIRKYLSVNLFCYCANFYYRVVISYTHVHHQLFCIALYYMTVLNVTRLLHLEEVLVNARTNRLSRSWSAYSNQPVVHWTFGFSRWQWQEVDASLWLSRYNAH